MYLDPGFGSMVIQLLVSGVAFAGVLLVSFRYKVQSVWRKLRGLPPLVNSADVDNTENDDFEKVE